MPTAPQHHMFRTCGATPWRWRERLGVAMSRSKVRLARGTARVGGSVECAPPCVWLPGRLFYFFRPGAASRGLLPFAQVVRSLLAYVLTCNSMHAVIGFPNPSPPPLPICTIQHCPSSSVRLISSFFSLLLPTRKPARPPTQPMLRATANALALSLAGLPAPVLRSVVLTCQTPRCGR